MSNSDRYCRVTRFLVFLTVLFAVFPAVALARTTCQPMQYGPAYWGGPPVALGQNCVAEVDFTRFAQTAADTQKQSQWCWAAVISMIFNYYGHPVQQARIVRDAYGSIVNMPAVNGLVIANQINRDWTDDRNRQFSARLTSAYDAQAGMNNTTNAFLINELHEERPFIIGTKNHAVVGTSMSYWRFPNGAIGDLTGVGVFDPWPMSQRARGLTPAEMTAVQNGGQLSFIATLSVSRR